MVTVHPSTVCWGCKTRIKTSLGDVNPLTDGVLSHRGLWPGVSSGTVAGGGGGEKFYFLCIYWHVD